MINFYHSFPTISRTVILMHTNSEVLHDVSHFSSHNEFIVTDLFSFRGTKWFIELCFVCKKAFSSLKRRVTT